MRKMPRDEVLRVRDRAVNVKGETARVTERWLSSRAMAPMDFPRQELRLSS